MPTCSGERALTPALMLTPAGDVNSYNYCNGACCPDPTDACRADPSNGTQICCAPSVSRPPSAGLQAGPGSHTPALLSEQSTSPVVTASAPGLSGTDDRYAVWGDQLAVACSQVQRSPPVTARASAAPASAATTAPTRHTFAVSLSIIFSWYLWCLRCPKALDVMHLRDLLNLSCCSAQ